MQGKIIVIFCLLVLPVPVALGQGTAENIISLNIDDLWVLVAAALVFFMQAGFKVLETGLVKTEHRAGIGAKNLLDWVAGSIAFFIIGFAFMFGTSGAGLIGGSFFFGNDLTGGKDFIFFLFQLAFAGTALTIVSGAMSGRTGVIPYFIASLMTAMFIYPVFGHWAWGNLLLPDNQPWLASMGFMDFAGSTVVHSTGAWIAIVGIHMVGPRIGRYDFNGNLIPMKASDYSYCILGVMILWLGWWGFNGGSTLAFDDSVAKIILNTNLAGAAACFSAFFHAVYWQDKKDVIEKLAGGSLTGLVAITACCNVVTPVSSLIIGLIAGVLHNVFYILLAEKLRLDDPVGAVAVHGIGGAFGTLAVALFGEADLLLHDRWWQLAVQAMGVVTCFVFTTSISLGMFFVIKKTIGLRVSPLEEANGAFVENLTEEQLTSEMDKRKVAQVSVRMSAKGYNMFTVQEYLKIDPLKRKLMIDEDRVKYMDETGSIMSPLVAVRQMGLMLEAEKNKLSKAHDQMKTSQEATEKSMVHAAHLQAALLGDADNFKELFESSFIYFQPRRKVSGDFYWFKKVGDFKIVIVSNGNVSGVSGGFLGMLGLSLVKEVFGANKLLYPEKVLDTLDRKLVQALRLKSLGMKLMDSMDVSIVIVDEMKRQIHFSGANSGLYHINGKGSKVYEGVDCPVGLKELKDNAVFKRETFSYQEGDRLYMFTDGYYKQQNKHGQQLTKSDFLDQLNEVQHEDFDYQKMLLEVDFDKWTDSVEQNDDVLVVGMKLR